MAQQPFYYPPPVNGAQYYAAPSAPLPANPIPIVGPQYCNPHPVDLAITRKVMAITDGNFVVSDVNDNIMFKVKAPFFSLHIRRIIIDAAGNPIITLRQKLMTAHQRWQVFRGESEDERDLIFTTKTSSLLQMKTKMDVFLAHNKAQVVCDYSIKGSWFERSCVIYAGESDSIVAQMHKKLSAESLIGKDKYMVTVNPNIDFAFITALILILDEANETYG